MMATPDEIDRLRDEWCVVLLEMTSSPAALATARTADRAGRPAYDVDPDPRDYRSARIQPRDVLVICARIGCNERFWSMHETMRYCCEHCKWRAAKAAARHRRGGMQHSAPVAAG